jgi:long-chain acyl-CoA synthetase
VNLARLAQPHRAESPALYDGGRWQPWGEVRRRASAVSRGLTELGVGPGDRVVVAWPTSADFVVAYLGVLACGAVAVPVNPNSPPPEMSRELAVVTPAVVLAGQGPAPAAAAAGASLEDVPVTVSPGRSSSPGAAPSWEELSGTAGSTNGEDDALGVVPRQAEDVAVLLFTSGTSGTARAAALTHGNLESNLQQMMAVPGEIVRPDDVSLAAVPLFHIFGLNVALGLTLLTGSALVLEERFDPADSLAMVRELRVTNLLGVPPMFAAWVAAARPRRHAQGVEALPRVRRAVCGAAALPAEVADAFERSFGVTVWQGYGLTEASPAVATSLGTGRHRPGSVGLPLPGVAVRLVDEAGDDVLAGDPGEVWVRGANVFAGYWRDADATAEVLGPDGWLRTGDIGVIGEDGDLFIVDRRKDIVIVSGFNVYPAEVEAVLGSLPGVAEAVVVGRPDPGTGEAVEAVIVVEPGATVTEAGVHDHCAARLARYKCPTQVRFVPEMPHGLAGKALRRAVREQAG